MAESIKIKLILYKKIILIIMCLFARELTAKDIIKRSNFSDLGSDLHEEEEEEEFYTDYPEETQDYDEPSSSFLVANISKYDCQSNICIIKCCSENQLFVTPTPESTLSGCSNVSLFDIEDWKPRDVKDYMLVYGFPVDMMTQNDANFVCSNYKTNQFYLNEDGTLYFYELKEYFSQNSYCIDNILENEAIHESAIICHEKYTKSRYDKVTDDLHTAAIAMSTVSLFIIILMYVISLHKLDLQKRCTFTCCGSLFLSYFALLINKTSVVKSITHNGCVTLGILTQFFFLSFYFWLNVNCYEIFRIIRGTFNLQSISYLSRSLKRFSIYCIYCYCCPLFICAVTVTMQLVPLSDFPKWMRPQIIKPRINEGRCWMEDGISELVYYYTFEIILHILNTFLMGHTSYLLYKEQLISTFCRRQTQTVNLRTHAAINHLDAFKQQLKIYLLYMFIWIVNTLSLINSRANFWRITDIIVALQGVFVALFILQTSKSTLVTPFYEKISNIAREFSSRVGEKKTFDSTNTEMSEINSNLSVNKK